MKLRRAKWHGLIFVGTRSGTIALQKAQRVNEEINAPEIRSGRVDGEQLGS
jgi:hypothetical protein